MAVILSTGRIVTNQNEGTNEGAPIVQYFNYLFKDEIVDWSDTRAKCNSECGKILDKKDLADCHPSIVDNFYLSTQSQPLVQRLHARLGKLSDKSTQQPDFCLVMGS